MQEILEKLAERRANAMTGDGNGKIFMATSGAGVFVTTTGGAP